MSASERKRRYRVRRAARREAQAQLDLFDMLVLDGVLRRVFVPGVYVDFSSVEMQRRLGKRAWAELAEGLSEAGVRLA